MQENSFYRKVCQLSDLKDCAEALLAWAEGECVWIFDAPMGAGKTTLIAAMCQVLEVSDVPASPTYALVHHYTSPKLAHNIWHFDLYRLESTRALYDIGFETYLEHTPPDVILIEWPQLAISFLESCIAVEIGVEDNCRMIKAEKKRFV
ncbi:MAG: tRNA (adenosine(37)-N6)-threonylcarbamoyltransferase complex ATPase subunit type 1 TsaE [Chitinophagales bacterium]|nr:tRNA (adenosine(37)-N6)-threonylcarbamoyltransferase complex ATPase subunit type 1 TsaE [Bacteroidota bacterium]MCB9043334.1 tRNA (adenosine(37)-N6)-threonylcarbamoyltransferase complex ATPase subunit type 1 TsaE [Chitinophagales bacterium]